MKAESIVFAIAGMCFGTILGWVLATQQAVPRTAAAPAATAAPAAAQGGGERQPPPLDEARVQGLMTIISSDPKNVGALVQLANTYFDAERYSDAIKWYQQSLEIDPKNVDASTDLGVSYYYSNQPDKALEQFDRSLKLDPKHAKTLLNVGIVKAFGKQDLDGATQAWQAVIALAPNSPEGQAAKRALDSLQSAHPAGSQGTTRKPGE